MKKYIRIKKEAFIEIPEDANFDYDNAIAYGQVVEGDIEYDTFIDIIDENDEVVNEAGWE